MTSDELTARTAVFTTRAAAQAAADAAMPRRRHGRPYAQGSGWHWARSVPCPECCAPPRASCPVPRTLHDAREHAARAAGPAADRWIVVAPSNTLLLTDGTMYDYQQQRRIGR